MTFWAVEVKPGKSIPADCKLLGGKLILTQATLGNGSSPKKSILQCHVRDRSPVFLCTLLPEKSESCSLNLKFDKEDNVRFSVVGPTSIHLAGFVQEVPQDSDDEGYGYDAHGEDVAGTKSEECDCNSKEFCDYDFIDDFNLQPPQEKLVEKSCSDLEAHELGKPEHLDLQKIADDVFKSTIIPFVEDVAYYTLMQTINNLKPRTVGQVLALLGYQAEDSSMSEKVEEELCALYVDSEGCRTRVAFGVMATSRVLDGAILPCGVVKVKIDGPIEKFAPLPCPLNDEITHVRHAVQIYVAWPRHLCFTISDFKGSNTYKESPHLAGFAKKVPLCCGLDAYGEDIASTESEESDSNSEESSDYGFTFGIESQESDYDTKKVVPEVKKTPTTDTKQSKAEQAKGKFVEKGCSDLLAHALGKPQNPDCVSDIGQGVDIKERSKNSSKGHGRGSGMSQEDIQKIVNEVVQLALPQTLFVKSIAVLTKKEMLKIMIHLFPANVDEALMNLSLLAEGSSMSEDVEGARDLYIDFEGSRILAAYGVITSSRVLNGVILPSGVVRVRVFKAIVDFAPLPCPVNDEITQVRHALGTYVAWPSNMII